MGKSREKWCEKNVVNVFLFLFFLQGDPKVLRIAARRIKLTSL